MREKADFIFRKGNSKAASLLQTLLEQHPNFTEKSLQKEIIFKNAFPDKSYDANYLRKQTAVLFDFTQHFLVEIENEADNFLKEKALLTQLRKRKLHHLFTLKMKSIQAQKRTQIHRDSDYYYQNFVLAEEADLQFRDLQERRYDAALQTKTDSLDAFYLAKKLKESCEILNRKKIIVGDYNLGLMEEILQILKPENLLFQLPPVRLYLQIYLTLKEEENEAHFHKLTELLEENYIYFSQKEAAGMYSYARNYCIRKINAGQLAYLRFLFDLYRSQLDSKVLLFEGILADNDYKNIITVGMQLQEKDWVFDFLHSYKKHLRDTQRENVFNYNLAIYYYSAQDYDSAIQLLNMVKFTDSYYEINGKIILLKTYFLQGEFQPFYYLLDAFKLSLLRNKKVAKDYRNAISNFLIQFKKIVKLLELKGFTDIKNYTSKREVIETRLNEIQPIYDRGWLLRELKKL